MSNETENLGSKFAENERFLKEMAQFQEWLKTETEKHEAKCINIRYQAEFAIIKEKIAFKIASKQIDLSFKFSEINFFNDKTSLEIFAQQPAIDFVNWLTKNGLTHNIETVDNSEVLVIVPKA